MKKTLVLVVLLMSFIVSFSSCKKSEEADIFDIRGTWGAVFKALDQTFTGTLTFSGNTTNGTVSDGTFSGSYNVNGNVVNFTIDATDSTYGRIHNSYSGTAANDNLMSGTLILLYYDLNNTQVNGTWTCNR